MAQHNSNKPKITFVLQYFHPEFASTAQLMTELAEELVKRGINVIVVTGQPSYLTRNRAPRREVYKGIQIERLPSTQFDKNKFLGRSLNWGSFTVMAFLRLLFSRGNSRLLIVSQPPFLFVVGWLLNIFRKQKYICLVYDLYPEIAIGLGVLKEKGIISKVWDGANKIFFNRAQYIIVPGENMRALIESKIKQNDKVRVISNWADGEFIKPVKKEENWFCKSYDLVVKLVVLYSGNIGLFHNLEILIEAADRLKDEKEIKFIFIGEGGKRKKLMRLVAEKRTDNVVFLPYQDRDRLPYSLTCGDISVVSLEKGLDCVASPCKLYTSLASGLAIMGITDSGSEVAQIIRKYNCGFNVEYDNVSGLVDALRGLSKNKNALIDMKKNSRRCFEENFQKSKMVEKYYELFTLPPNGSLVYDEKSSL